MMTESFGRSGRRRRRTGRLVIAFILMLSLSVQTHRLFLVITNQNLKSEMVFASDSNSSSGARTNISSSNGNNTIPTVNNAIPNI